MADYQRIQIPVDGGELAAGRWGTGGHVLVASHGITANHLSWRRVGELLIERSDGAVSLLAVDHRGRAGSAAIPGPFGLAQHADDVVAALTCLELESTTLLGHSMGGFVVALAAERHPGRVERLVLVDGGLPFPMDVPADADVEAVVQSVIGPALDRLDQRWTDEDAYVAFFRNHPAFRPPNQWWETVEAYVRYDAVAEPAGLVRSSVSKDAVLVDGGAAIVDPHTSSALLRISTPTTLLWAPRGILDQSPGLYPEDEIAKAEVELAHVHPVLVPDTNHYTIAFGDQGAGAVVDAALAA